MSSMKQILLAGFGGQGILFMGKFLAHAGLLEGLEVSWLPSYGPEMRGGTANCSVILSDTPIGSPIVSTPDVLAVLNAPSFDKFEAAAVPGAVLVVDSSLVPQKSERDDIRAFYIPATQISFDENLEGLSNMIVLGKLIREAGLFTREQVQTAMEGVISAKKKNLLDFNLKAIDIGYTYES